MVAMFTHHTALCPVTNWAVAASQSKATPMVESFFHGLESEIQITWRRCGNRWNAFLSRSEIPPFRLCQGCGVDMSSFHFAHLNMQTTPPSHNKMVSLQRFPKPLRHQVATSLRRKMRPAVYRLKSYLNRTTMQWGIQLELKNLHGECFWNCS